MTGKAKVIYNSIISSIYNIHVWREDRTRGKRGVRRGPSRGSDGGRMGGLEKGSDREIERGG